MIDLYKNQAQLFDTYALQSYPWRFIERPALERHLGAVRYPGIRILDAGSGSGRVTQFLLDQAIPTADILGVDSSVEMIKIAKLKFPEVQFDHIDIGASYTAPSQFGLVICMNVLAQLSPQQLALAMENFKYALHPRGALVFIIGHPMRYVDGERYFTQRRREQTTPWGTVIDHHHRTVMDYLEATTQAGFLLDAIEELTVPKAGIVVPHKYEEHRFAPSRLVVRAVKPSNTGRRKEFVGPV